MLDVSGLGHRYGGANGHQAIADLTFQVRTGELACIVGPSGCGKSTMLRSISGLIKPSAGDVKLGGNPVNGVPEDLAVVFQDYSRSLFPWLSVRSNVEFPLRSRGLSKAERRSRADEVLEWVGLSAAAKKYPWQLSGGMQQRVSIARALACRPALLLMDEPFASVDAQTRFELEDLLLRVRKQFDSTVLLVTHDIDESIYLADRVFVLSKSPASIVADLEIPLGDERDQITTRESETFVHLRSEVARLLDVRSAHAPAKGDAAPAKSDVDDAESTAKQWAEAEKAEAERADARN
ncbi:ABC transporter ATP-binding protein [Saccharopolyspora elongata]|uniref:ABC transporter ATP-binding protein n=1 Tax=Saccharopolyspora elongata TaxID=2530387 RepID=A0A4V2YM77_9PSEU|nr:ABC transporter ATP-binding protein [Saccharopolyspora elongata]TDD49487.1 ABC transporter ATP-binding protein [Saccharopolyspora elongata]